MPKQIEEEKLAKGRASNLSLSRAALLIKNNSYTKPQVCRRNLSSAMLQQAQQLQAPATVVEHLELDFKT